MTHVTSQKCCSAYSIRLLKGDAMDADEFSSAVRTALIAVLKEGSVTDHETEKLRFEMTGVTLNFASLSIVISRKKEG